MKFPPTLDIILYTAFVQNVSKFGEVTEGYSDDLPIVELLSKELRFSYKLYSFEFHKTGDFLVGNFPLLEHAYYRSVYPILISDYTFAIEKPGYASNSLSFLRSFSTEVWIGIFLTAVLVTIIKFLIFQRRVPFISVLFFSSVAFFGVHREWKPKSNAQKLVVLTWSIGINFLSMSFGALILSFLTVPVREKGITNFDELHDAMKKGQASALKLRFSGVDEEFIKSGSEKLSYIGHYIQNQNSVTLSDKGNFLQVIKSNVAVIGSRQFLEKYYGGDRYLISKDSVFLQMGTIVDAYKNWPSFCCKDEVNAAIHRIWSSGLFLKNRADYKFNLALHYSSVFPNMYSSFEVTIQPLSLPSMSGAFYLLIIGHILAIMCLVYENVTYRYFQKIPNSV